MRILVVEDIEKMAALLQRGLTEQGYAVDVATTGEDALWLASETSYAAIVLDIVLEGRVRTGSRCVDAFVRRATGRRC